MNLTEKYRTLSGTNNHELFDFFYKKNPLSSIEKPNEDKINEYYDFVSELIAQKKYQIASTVLFDLHSVFTEQYANFFLEYHNKNPLIFVFSLGEDKPKFYTDNQPAYIATIFLDFDFLKFYCPAECEFEALPEILIRIINHHFSNNKYSLLQIDNFIESIKHFPAINKCIIDENSYRTREETLFYLINKDFINYEQSLDFVSNYILIDKGDINLHKYLHIFVEKTNKKPAYNFNDFCVIIVSFINKYQHLSESNEFIDKFQNILNFFSVYNLNIDSISSSGDNILMHIFKYNHMFGHLCLQNTNNITLVSFFLLLNGDINYVNPSQETVGHVLIKESFDAEVLYFMIFNGLDILKQDKNMENCFDILIRYQNYHPLTIEQMKRRLISQEKLHMHKHIKLPNGINRL